MAVSPWRVEGLSAGVRDLYADAEARLLGIVARQLSDGFEAPGWAVAKLADIQPLRRSAQQVVDALSTAVDLEVWDVVAEAYNVGARAGLAELGALGDEEVRRIAETTPATRAVDRLAQETIDLVTETHRGILRGVEDGYRQVIAEVSATPLLGIDSRRQATQRAMERFSDRGLRTFVDKSGRAWQMTSYAEMATRTAVGRAAVEGHTDRLRAAGLDLVIVSNAPHECPVCQPYEGKVLSIDGPDGPHEVEVEHALDDGRTVRVDVAGSLNAARTRGFQHPNCRHSVAAYLAGVTRAPEDASEDPDGYEATQKQRAIERSIRKWKNRAAAATTPEAKRAAEARVRGWQGRMRGHLADHPELIRRREREELGAGNLPPDDGTAGRAGTPSGPGTDPFEAARVRAGDDRTLPEMNDEQLGAAIRPGVLDERDRGRIAREADRRDEQDLLDRIRPNGRLADSLAEFSDDELARVSLHLDDDGMLRVMAEMDRRDVDAALPGARRDLVGMSERELADRARNVVDDRPAIGAEVNRRGLLAEVFPGGRLAGDLSAVGDDVLGWAVRYAVPDDAVRIADELDGRYPPAELPDAQGAFSVEGQLADRAALDEILAPAAGADTWNGLSVDWYAGMSSTERWIAEREYADLQMRTAYTRAEMREMYREHVWSQMLAAEDATNGYMLSKAAQAAGVDPVSLFSGPAHIAYARASEELRRWWQDHPRMTLAEYEEMVTGLRSSAADTARASRSTQNNRL
ncbi:phage capsid protein [Streptomyces sp. NBC_00988]|uniref:phage minor capsid protein n=1 Tax=Streptomyces sp. NBC_00988 TaxID=2903704 RepID=UPI00386A6363|nr:phage capsid protein [Streptomyces sp. NBC_00988]